MTTAVDPVAAFKAGFAWERERAAADVRWRAQWPMIAVPCPADRALGYRFIAADEAQLVAVSRRVTARAVLDLARARGWWVAACQVLTLELSNRKDETKGLPQEHERIGVHGFWPSRRAQDGTVGVVGWWDNGDFEWAARADYRIVDDRLTYSRTPIGAQEIKRVIKEMGAS